MENFKPCATGVFCEKEKADSFNTNDIKTIDLLWQATTKKIYLLKKQRCFFKKYIDTLSLMIYNIIKDKEIRMNIIYDETQYDSAFAGF